MSFEKQSDATTISEPLSRFALMRLVCTSCSDVCSQVARLAEL